MAYSPTAWINNSEPAITAEKLNKMEFGIASAHGIAEAKASTDYVQGQIANEVNARVAYVENSFANFEANLTGDNSIIIPVIEQELADPTSNSTTAIKQTAITATDTNWSLSTLTTNLASEFGENASNISTKLGTYASNDDVGAIAQVALDVDGRITGWTAVDSSVGGSAFRINADTFSLADANNEHAPFTIDVDSGLTVFNGKVTFSNTISDTDGRTLQEYIDDLNSTINTKDGERLLDIAQLDGKIDDKEQELINSINLETQNRIDAIAQRVQEEARLDGLITAEEQARIDSANALTLAYKNYTDTVKQALIDGEITQAEQNAIDTAQSAIDTAKANLENQINSLTKVEDISWQEEVQAVIDGSPAFIDGGKIVMNTALVNNLNAVGGIVADSVSAENITGTTITGKLIYGSTFQASYLDFNNGFKLLTAYQIPVSTYNANPSLYSDAILRDGYSTYRIPTLSLAAEELKSGTLGYNQSLYGRISSYNTANTGDFYKARLIRPMIATVSSGRIISTSALVNLNVTPSLSLYEANRVIDFGVYVGSTLILQVKLIGGLYKQRYDSSPPVSAFGYIQVTCPYGTSYNSYTSTFKSSSGAGYRSETYTYYSKATIDTGVFKFDAEFNITLFRKGLGGDLGASEWSTIGSAAFLDLKANSTYLPFNWTGGKFSIKNFRSNCTVDASFFPGIYVDNMQ